MHLIVIDFPFDVSDCDFEPLVFLHGVETPPLPATVETFIAYLSALRTCFNAVDPEGVGVSADADTVAFDLVEWTWRVAGTNAVDWFERVARFVPRLALADGASFYAIAFLEYIRHRVLVN